MSSSGLCLYSFRKPGPVKALISGLKSKPFRRTRKISSFDNGLGLGGGGCARFEFVESDRCRI